MITADSSHSNATGQPCRSPAGWSSQQSSFTAAEGVSLSWDDAAGIAAPGLHTFLDSDGSDDQAGDRVGPTPAQQAVQQQTDEQHRRQIGAEQGLGGVGDHASRAQRPAGAPLRPRQAAA